MTTEKTISICQQNETGKYGLIDSDGKVIIPFEYDSLGYYSEKGRTLVPVEKNKKEGVFDMNGKVILPCEYDEIEIDTDENHKAFFTVKTIVRNPKNWLKKKHCHCGLDPQSLDN